MGKTQDALALVRQGIKPYQAAQQAGIKPPTLYAALKREKVKVLKAQHLGVPVHHCPVCGQKLAIAESIRQSLAKNPALTLERVLQWLER